MIQHHTFLFVGPPSSGKGTQSALLAAEFNLPRVDVGAILRDRSREHDALAQQLMADMSSGGTVADATIRPIAEPVFIATVKSHQGLIIDGYCRTAEQVEHLNDLVEEKKIPPVIVVHITVNEDEATRRMQHRRYCSGCNAQQYLVTDTDTATACLRCGGHLIKRSDDSLEIFKNRIATYNRATIPAISALSKRFSMITVDGEHSIETVHRTIMQELNHGSY